MQGFEGTFLSAPEHRQETPAICDRRLRNEGLLRGREIISDKRVAAWFDYFQIATQFHAGHRCLAQAATPAGGLAK